MQVALRRIATLTVFATLAVPAQSQVLTEKNISLAMAMTIAQTAIETCKANGYVVSVHVLDRAGLAKVALRADGAPLHTFENSDRKAYTSRTFRIPSGEFAKRVAQPGANGAQFLSRTIALQGALPIKIGEDVIGSVGVSGAPGGEKDEVCAQAGIDKVADQLK